MTTLTKPLSRIVETLSGEQVVVTIVPTDAGIQAHVKFRRPDESKSFASFFVDPQAKP